MASDCFANLNSSSDEVNDDTIDGTLRDHENGNGSGAADAIEILLCYIEAAELL